MTDVAINSGVLEEYDSIGPALISKGPTRDKFALIFGWCDSQFKHVEKYAQYYVANGYTAVVQLGKSADFHIIWNKHQEFEEFEPLLAYLAKLQLLESSDVSNEEQEQGSHPTIVIHSFSNGGMFKIKRFVNFLFSKGFQLKKAKAIILDSSPSKVTAPTLAGYVASTQKNTIVKYLAYGSAYAFGCGYLAFGNIEIHPITQSIPYVVSEENGDGNIRGPRLFLFSHADEVVPFQDVKENAEAARVEGIRVVEKVFSTSAHVKHAVEFKEEYWSSVTEFLERKEE
ncbi:hypothetical protein BDR26DRAFT_1008898 [Obelidium mucronatum]|nr:hypothetical protein BDR26DRAFT_1008898 [Obelidium mucronatum]